MSGLAERSDEFQVGLRELDKLVQSLRAFGVPDDRFRISLNLMGRSLYHGTVFDVVLPEAAELKSFCWGGRHHQLGAAFSNEWLHGLGFTLDLSQLFSMLVEKGLLQSAGQSVASTVIFPLQESDIAQSHAIATSLRHAGLPVLLAAFAAPLAAKLQYARLMQMRFALVLGQNDMHSVQITNVETGVRQTVERTRIVAFLKNQPPH